MPRKRALAVRVQEAKDKAAILELEAKMLKLNDKKKQLIRSVGRTR